MQEQMYRWIQWYGQSKMLAEAKELRQQEKLYMYVHTNKIIQHLHFSLDTYNS